MFAENKLGYEILTPEGFKAFKGVNKRIKGNYVKLTFTDASILKCSTNHQIWGQRGYRAARSYKPGQQISGKILLSCELIKEKCILYDPAGVADNQSYISNDIISHNCDFLGSQYTLISAEKLVTLAIIPPIRIENGMRIFADSISNHQYFMVCDVSKGVERDYSTITVIDCTSLPYRIVATFRSNEVSPYVFPNYIYQLGKYYNEAYCLIETNKVDKVAYILHQDLGYDNMIRTTYNTNHKQRLASLVAGTVGVDTDKKIKRIGCLSLKQMIEQDKLIVPDEDMINELCQFVEVKESYAADPDSDATDDMVMTLVLFAWLASESLFTQLTDHDLRKKLLDRKDDYIDDNFLPSLLISDNNGNSYVPTLSDTIFSKWMKDDYQTDNDSSGAFNMIWPIG